MEENNPANGIGDLRAMQGHLIDMISRNQLAETKTFLKEFVMQLQKKDADFTLAGISTALLGYAAENDAPDTLKFLIEMGADINVHKNPDHKTSNGSRLHQALMTSSMQAAMVLIEQGADLNARNDAGDTPLHFAVLHCFSYPEVILKMLEKGADLRAKNYADETPEGLVRPLPEIKKVFEDFLAVRAKEEADRIEKERSEEERIVSAAHLEKLKTLRPPKPSFGRKGPSL